MPTKGKELKWTPVDLIGWTRRAYGRDIVFESTGGTLAAEIAEPAGKSAYLRLEVTGRMLVQVLCGDEVLYDDFVSNGELDTFLRLPEGKRAGPCKLELHLIPATFGDVKVPQALPVVAADEMMDVTGRFERTGAGFEEPIALV